MRTRTFTTAAYFPREGPHPTMRFNDRLSVTYKVWDQPNNVNPPPAAERFNLLFLHGSQMIKEIWTYYAELAFKQWGDKLDKVIAMDTVTHGDSALLNATKVTAWSSWTDIGRDAGLVLDDMAKLGELDGPVIAAGHSMGGAGAIFLSIFHTSKIDGLILMDPVWGGSWPEEHHQDNPMNRAVAGMIGKVFDNAREEFDSYEDYEHFMKTRFISKTFHPRIRDSMIKNHAYTDVNGKLRSKNSRAMQVGAYLSASSIMKAPTTIFKWTPISALILHGDVADFNPPGDMASLAKTLRKAEIHEIPGGGHNVFFQKPDECFAAMISYIDNHVARALERRKKYQVNEDLETYTEKQVRGEIKYMTTTGRRTSFAKL